MSRVAKTLSVTSKLHFGHVVHHTVSFYKRDHWRTDTGLILWVNNRSVYLVGGFNRFIHGEKRWEQKKTPHWYKSGASLIGYLTDWQEVPASEMEAA